MKFQKNLTLVIVLIANILIAQNPPLKYKAEKDKINALVHTKLKVHFNFEKKELYGKEWVTLQPYFYPTSKVVLDAKVMLIHKIELEGKKLDYSYDNKKLIINLPKEYKRGEQYTLYIQYTARPEKVNQQGSAAITSAKGLYFIDAEPKKGKDLQVWTQGETEASSCWFPTIDSPNQKTSQEIYITVPKKYITLSNGKLESQINNANGTRTDYWHFTKKHAPYLFFMGIGNYQIIKDSYKDIPVNYYVEKEYAAYAKDIFGDTPEMIAFFSKITGVEYPWSKYSQIVGRNYVSGAMENTTAVIHGENAYQKSGQLIDGNRQENTIAHEIFHHWFGNLVTAESWSNLTVNESFANYSEYLWREYKYGKANADMHLAEQVEVYKQGKHIEKHLVRFYYNDKEDMFDAVSYNKGGVILHMLRNYIGDTAFFEAMKVYLTDNKYKTGEAHQWRLALEKVTGKDLNWFFNQWYFSGGHPKLEISYDYNTLLKTVTVNIFQIQNKEFKFPLAIDIFENEKRTRHKVFVTDKDASFKFSYNKQPTLIQVNADNVLLCDIIENKVLSEYIFQLKNAKSYVHKKEALLKIAKQQEDKKAFKAIANAMLDGFYKIRILALKNINLANKYGKKAIIDKIKTIANSDKKTLVQAAAIETLGKLTDSELQPIFKKALQSKSYTVLGKALVAMYYIDKKLAIKKSKELPNEVKKIIAIPLTRIYLESNDESEMAFVANNVISGIYLSTDKRTQSLYKKAYNQIVTSNNSEAIQNLVTDIITKGKQFKQYNFDKVGVNLLYQMIQIQKKANTVNKVKNIAIIETALDKLIQ